MVLLVAKTDREGRTEKKSQRKKEIGKGREKKYTRKPILVGSFVARTDRSVPHPAGPSRRQSQRGRGQKQDDETMMKRGRKRNQATAKKRKSRA